MLDRGTARDKFLEEQFAGVVANQQKLLGGQQDLKEGQQAVLAEQKKGNEINAAMLATAKEAHDADMKREASKAKEERRKSWSDDTRAHVSRKAKVYTTEDAKDMVEFYGATKVQALLTTIHETFDAHEADAETLQEAANAILKGCKSENGEDMLKTVNERLGGFETRHKQGREHEAFLTEFNPRMVKYTGWTVDEMEGAEAAVKHYTALRDPGKMVPGPGKNNRLEFEELKLCLAAAQNTENTRSDGLVMCAIRTVLFPDEGLDELPGVAAGKKTTDEMKRLQKNFQDNSARKKHAQGIAGLAAQLIVHHEQCLIDKAAAEFKRITQEFEPLKIEYETNKKKRADWKRNNPSADVKSGASDAGATSDTERAAWLLGLATIGKIRYCVSTDSHTRSLARTHARTHARPRGIHNGATWRRPGWLPMPWPRQTLMDHVLNVCTPCAAFRATGTKRCSKPAWWPSKSGSRNHSSPVTTT